jgi:hypothetical protein
VSVAAFADSCEMSSKSSTMVWRDTSLTSGTGSVGWGVSIRIPHPASDAAKATLVIVITTRAATPRHLDALETLREPPKNAGLTLQRNVDSMVNFSP